ncbi:fatty acid/sphingolipid desaturase [Cucurbitaria berberidis CBS 394.84]|uniref:Delta 8-(E)-sphingolipid desaturase n=1 Tax=Cucurbitaria berberidis CBS 394.84 TaxID=1168544 RepID=A0A9P4L7C3_9PLEO|nr:fatty acid/sphingolipid desaturase [Cucurbitaria berberidis CBS 394.84]KAF1844896.1 fatty acid/sphingolipid desaturase [Cucurbitaria berberidis CBS 394.84]
MSRHRIVSPAEVQRLIAQNQPIVIHEGYVLHLGEWIDKHPGGRLAILHMVGRDATDEINIYHTNKALLMMTKHRIGRVELPWANLEPPIRSPEFYKNLKLGEKSGVIAHGDGHRSRKSVDLGSAAAIISKKLMPVNSCVRRTSVTPDPEKLPLLESEAPTIDTAEDKLRHREQFATEEEKREIEEGIRDNPSLDVATQRAIVEDYRALHQQFKDEGLYQCRYSEYAKESLRYGFLFAAFASLLYCKWYLSSAVFLGLFWQQIMFTAHDAGHRGITSNFVADTLIGAFIADFCCGLSIGWWKSSHNVHHLITNMPEHDPDIQNIPLFSTSPTYMKSILSSFYNFQFVWDGACDFMVPYQKYTYYPVMALARFNLYFLGWLHLCSPRAAQLGAAWWTRPLEIVFMCCYWYIFGYLLVWVTLPTWPIRIGFVLTSHLVTMILHVQITLSHWGMPTSDLGPTESFPQRQMRTTMDVDCPAWLDWVHGGLQFQAVHHLFPRVPRHNLRRGQELVREFSAKTGVKYHCYNFVEGNKVVLSRLEQVGQMAKMMVDCQKSMAETGESGLH